MMEIASTGSSGQGTKNKRGEESPLEKHEDWVVDIKEKLYRVSPCRGDSLLDHCIFMVPRNLRETQPKAFIPQLVSIGPYHRGNLHLKELERHKWRFLRHVLEVRKHPVEYYLQEMEKLEKKTRQFYSISIDMGSREFVEMMLLDACFILELLKDSVKGYKCCRDSWLNTIFTFRGILPCIQRDMLMLENQLPLFVLNRLFELTCDPPFETTVTQLALQFFDSVIPTCLHHEEVVTRNKVGLHLLHVFREGLLPPSCNKARLKRSYRMNPEDKHQFRLMMHSVSKLRDSGVKFRKKESKKFMDIEFKDGVLYIPPLVIDDSTRSIFLNLMAFEQCYPHCINHVASYVRFMDGLINSPRDVRYLRDKGIVDHRLGSEEEVAFLFNNICREIILDVNDCYLSPVSADVKKYFKKWHTWKASLQNDYFKSPWAILSLLAAILLIGLTVTQTMYGALAFHFPPS